MPEPLDKIFDRVMRIPESQRGMDAENTSRLLAEELKRLYPNEYEARMHEMEAHYLDQFLNTIAANPAFASRIRSGMALYR